MKKVNLDIDEEVFLPCYRHLLDSEANINFLWGGRDSGKSYYIAQKLIVDCLSKGYFRCILIKKTAESVKDSQWQTIKDICELWGISHLFEFNTSPLEIRCVNGNKFIARGCDKPAKLKSISNPSHAWYEEGNQLTEQDYIVATTTLRSSHGDVQEWFSFNPECEDVDYNEYWLFKTFFAEHYATGELSFTGKVEFTMPDNTTFVRTYTSTHTTYHDNPNCPPSRIANHESLKTISPYYYTVFTLGLWGRRITGGEFLKCFKRAVHVGNVPYDPSLALHLSFDENVVPYFPCGVFQIKEKEIRMIDEVMLYSPNNKVGNMCREIIRRYQSHAGGVFIYGDATSRKEDVKQEHGHDIFRLLINGLEQFNPGRRVSESNPSVVMSGNFFNTILETQVSGISFMMDERCKISIRDFENTREKAGGEVDKKTIKDPVTKRTYQPFGHVIDLTRYLICRAFPGEYGNYQRGNKPLKISTGPRISKNSW